jgi:hypothetical protein
MSGSALQGKKPSYLTQSVNLSCHLAPLLLNPYKASQNRGPLSYIIHSEVEPPDEAIDVAFAIAGSRFGSPRG